MQWSWKSFGLQFVTILLLGMGLAYWISMTIAARRGPGAPTDILFSMTVAALLAPIIPALISGWKGLGMKPLLVACGIAAALYSGHLGATLLSVIIAIFCYFVAQKTSEVVFYYRKE